jgi:hypothetical protein
MSTEAERTATEAHRTAVDVEHALQRRIEIENNCASRNEQEHARLLETQAQHTNALASLKDAVGGLSKSFRVGAFVLAVASVAVPAWSQIRAAYATEHVTEVAREATRQEFERLKSERAVEIQNVATATSRETVRLLVTPEIQTDAISPNLRSAPVLRDASVP